MSDPVERLRCIRVSDDEVKVKPRDYFRRHPPPEWAGYSSPQPYLGRVTVNPQLQNVPHDVANAVASHLDQLAQQFRSHAQQGGQGAQAQQAQAAHGQLPPWLVPLILHVVQTVLQGLGSGQPGQPGQPATNP